MASKRAATGWMLFTSTPLVAAALPAEPAPDATEDEKSAPVWIQIAREGEFRGHPAGPFTLTRTDLEQVAANFRRHPDFHLGANGSGDARVIAYDFHHASEQDPAKVGTMGAPAQAWALDLDVRDADDGTAQLWALTEYLEPMRTYAREGRYKSTSVAIWPDAVDPVTAQPIGWYLSSIAFTNDPFIQGMMPIAATRGVKRSELTAKLLSFVQDAPKSRALCGGWYETAGSTEEAVTALRKLFAIPATGDLGSEIAKVLAMLTGAEAAPVGVDLDDAVEAMRKILGLPLLTDATTVAQEAMRVAGSPVIVPAQLTANDTGQGAEPHALSGSTGHAVTNQAGIPMDELLKILASRYNIPTDADSVQKRVLAELEAGANAQTAMQNVLDLLGSADLEAAKAQVAKFKEAMAALEMALPELKAMGEAAMSTEDEAAIADVEQVMQTTRSDESMRPALLAFRTGGVKLTADCKASEVLEARLAARDAFRKHYDSKPVAADPAVPAYLTRAVATPAPVSPILRALSSRVFEPGSPAAPLAPEAPPGVSASSALDEIEKCPGRNITERAIALVRSRPGGAALSHEAAHQSACALIAAARASAN